MRSLGIHLRALSLDEVKIPINKTRLKIAELKCHPGLPGPNELTKLALQLRHGWIDTSHCSSMPVYLNWILSYSMDEKLHPAVHMDVIIHPLPNADVGFATLIAMFMGLTWGPPGSFLDSNFHGGPHVGLMNIAIWEVFISKRCCNRYSFLLVELWDVCCTYFV